MRYYVSVFSVLFKNILFLYVFYLVFEFRLYLIWSININIKVID